MRMSLTVENLRALCAERDAEGIRKLCKSRGIPALAHVLVDLTPEETRFVLTALAPRKAGKVLVELPEAYIPRVVTREALPALARILEEMESDDLTDVARHLSDPVRVAALRRLGPEKTAVVASLLDYEEGTVGSIMRTEFFHVPVGVTAQEAFDLLRARRISLEQIHNVYLLDDEGKLRGLLPLSRAILAEPSSRLLESANTEPITITPDAPDEEALLRFREYDLPVLPVVRTDGTMLGVVTNDDILDVEEEETTVDFHKMAPVLLKGQSLREASRLHMITARAPWLVILVFMNIFSGAGIAYFEDTIEAVVALVFFLPLLIDSGGNAGSQSATLMVRALATGDVYLRDWARMFAKEISIALSLGLLMALAVAAVAAFRAPEILMPVSLTMVATVLFGSLVGMCLPFLLTKLKLDPATASAPLITSIADIGGVLIYFSIAAWWLGPVLAAAAG